MNETELAKLRATHVLLDIMNAHKERIAELLAIEEQEKSVNQNGVAICDPVALYMLISLIFSRPYDKIKIYF